MNSVIKASLEENFQSLLAVYRERDENHIESVKSFDNYCKNKIDETDKEIELMKAEILEEKKLWENEKIRVAAITKFENPIKLDVGGVRFSTTLSTLCCFPASTIAAMFSGRHELHTDSDGTYFIDRDGTHFRYILNFLRNPDDFVLDIPDIYLKELQLEAKYYGLLAVMFPIKPRNIEVTFCPQKNIGIQCLLSRSEDGVWYYETIVAASGIVETSKTPVIVCKQCTSGYIVRNNGNYVGDTTFSANRIIFPAQPLKSSNESCPSCGLC